MSIFDRFESAVERGVNGAFSRVFRSGIKAVDITSALKRSMEDHVQELSTDRAIAPNHFLIRMAPTDMDALGDLDILAGEFAQQVTDHAALVTVRDIRSGAGAESLPRVSVCTPRVSGTEMVRVARRDQSPEFMLSTVNGRTPSTESCSRRSSALAYSMVSVYCPSS